MNWRPKKRVYKLPNGHTKVVWLARYGRNADGKELFAKPPWNGGKATFELRRDAQRAIDEELARPVRERERVCTVGGYLPRWLEEHPPTERTDATNAHRIGRVLDVKLEGKKLREWELRELRRRHANELVTNLLKHQGRNPGGCRAILRALSAMAEDAMTDEFCDLNPWKGIKVRDADRRATKPPKEIRVWTFAEMHEFASYGGKYEAMLRTMADCGVRLGECIAIQRGDYRRGELEIRFTAWRGKLIPSSRKKNHDRIVPVPPSLDSMLAAMPVQLHSEFLFPTPTGRMWLEENWRRDVWKRTVEAANTESELRRRGGHILNPTPHEMRHSWNSNLRAAGIDPADLADVAGHSVETATRHYTHAMRQSFDQIRSVIG